jgi:uncharacterized protein HemY
MPEPDEKAKLTAQRLVLTGARRTLDKLITQMERERDGIEEELERLKEEAEKLNLAGQVPKAEPLP